MPLPFCVLVVSGIKYTPLDSTELVGRTMLYTRYSQMEYSHTAGRVCMHTAACTRLGVHYMAPTMQPKLASV